MIIIDRNTDINTIKYCPFCYYLLEMKDNLIVFKIKYCPNIINCNFNLHIMLNMNYDIFGYDFKLVLNSINFFIQYDFRENEYALIVNKKLVYLSKSNNLKLDLHNVVDIEKQIKLLLTFQ